ncbi:MAG TPA: glycosyltransferase family 4 protein [Chthoniobacteraceae bacterium]
MKIILLTPGTGSYHCGVCMRDNALAKELIRQGHDAVMVPMYLPLTLDESAATPRTPIFFGGVTTYLREKVPLLRRMPRWMDRLLSSRALLRLVAGKAAAQTGGPDVAEMTLSMLRGEQGNQATELDELIAWLRADGKPDAVWLSTALQAGLARKIKAALGVPVIGFLQGEDSFLDGLGTGWSSRAWAMLAERMRDADLWIAPSRYFAELMATRLGWSLAESAHRMRVVPNGISLEGYRSERRATTGGKTQTIGYLARFIPAKGLGLLVDAFIHLKQSGRGAGVRLRCAGSMTDTDAVYVDELKRKLSKAELAGDVEWLPNVTREEKIAFLETLDVFSVPATYSEAFGMYVIEALAAGVPVIAPEASAFPEILAATGGGRLFQLDSDPDVSAAHLADVLAGLLADPAAALALGEAGRLAVREQFSIESLARHLARLTGEIRAGNLAPSGAAA